MNKLDEILQKDKFNIQDLAFITQRKTQTIRSWEKKGIIKEADERATNNWRQYSLERTIDILESLINYPWERQVIKNVDEVKYVIDNLKQKAVS